MAALLAGALFLSALLAWQAYTAARSQRRAAEGVLRDYARFAGREFLRRARNEVDYFAFYPVVYKLAADERLSPGRELPNPEETAQLPLRLGRAPLPVRSVFRANLASGRVVSSPGAPQELVSWAVENLPALFASRASAEGEIAAVSLTVAGTPRTVVYGVSPDAARLAFGFEVDVRQLAPYLEKALREGPLLPTARATASPGHELVALDLDDAWGRRIFHGGYAFEPELEISERLSGPPAGVFRGMRLHVSVPRSAADQLVIGGLPRSRLPLLLAALTLAAGLLVAAIILSRRELALAQLRSDFVSGVSHELRTPLAQIRLFAETLILDRVRSSEERRHALEIIDHEARRLSQLVENTLQFSRAENGTIPLHRETQDLARLVFQTVEGFRPLAAAHEVRISPEIDGDVTASVDEGAIRQILVNLLDNAVKYGPSGQRVLVRLAREAGEIRLSVEDQGPGIPARLRARIWEKFVRLDQDRETHRSGTGIGLSVVRELVLLHGGRAWVEEASGGGSRFIVSFPADGDAA